MRAGGGAFGSDYATIKYVQEPIPDIKANGSDSTITIAQTDTLSVTVLLDPSTSLGQNADWWVFVNTPLGWYHYGVFSGSWTPGLVVLEVLFDEVNLSQMPDSRNRARS